MPLNPKALPDNIVLYGTSMWENTAKVIPPQGGLCPHGRIVVNLGEPRASAGLVYRDLLDAGGIVATTAPTTKVAYPLDPAIETNATDNQLIRLQDQSLMAIKNGYIWSDLSPKPAWFDTVDIKYTGALGPTTSKRARNAVLVFRSTDAAQSWVLWSIIDAAVVENGDYGYPQGDGAGNYGVGGFDRTDLYQDPWSQAIYVSGHGDGGPYKKNDNTTVENHAGIIFVSHDNGKTWGTLYKKFGSGAPYVMTSTPDYPLIVFRLTGSGPWLHYLDTATGTLNDGQSVIATVNGNLVAAATDPKADDLRGSPPCIARAGKGDHVWTAYPTLNSSGRQDYVICSVTLGGGGTPIVKVVATIEAEDPAQASCVLGAFVQDDHVDSQGPGADDLALFYWIEAPPKDSPLKDQLLARYKVLFSGGQFDPGYLSVSNGQRRYFARSASGDYFQGGSFRFAGTVNFLAQWREEDGIKGNVVSVTPPPSKPDVREVAIDPMALVLSGQIYVRLTLPDPAPIEGMREEIRRMVHAMTPKERKSALAHASTLRTFAVALHDELANEA